MNVPTVDAPTVMPSGAPVNVSAPAQAFGASVVGSALEDVGKTLGVGSDMLAKHAELQANLDASAAANDAAVATSQAQDNLTLKYRTENPGIRAEGALPQYYADLDKSRTTARAALGSPLAQKMFDAQTRLQQEKLQVSNATWASGEVKQSRVASWKSFLDNQSRGTTLDTIDQEAATIEPTLRSWAAQEGWSEEQVTAARSAWIGNTAYALANGVAGKNPRQAQDVLEKYGEYMNPQERGVLQNQIQSSVDAHLVSGIADEKFVTSSASDGDVGGTRDYYKSRGWSAEDAAAITGTLMQESGLQAHPSGNNDGGHAHGIAQWHEDRQEDFERFAGHSIQQSTLAEQQAFVHYELTQGNFAETGRKLREAKTLEEKSAVLIKHYEMPEDQGPQEIARRTQQAREALAAGSSSNFSKTPQATLDAQEQNAPQALAEIAADSRLRGDPILINNAQRQYLTNLSQARQVQNLATKGAFDRLYTAMIQGNIQDTSQLQTAYPEANADYASLPEASRQTLQRQAGASANMWTPERDQNWQRLYGMSINDPGKFSQVDLTQFQLTHSNRDTLFKEQQQIIAKKATSQANVTSGLQLEPVKQALANRSDLKPDSPSYDQFTGAFAERMQEFMDAHGGKIGAEDKAKIAIGLLGTVPAHDWGGLHATTLPAFGVSPEVDTAIRAQIEPHIGRKLTPYEVGQVYARTHHGR